MLITVSTTISDPSDLGRLLHKHPDRLQVFALPFGHATVVYPESSLTRCTAAMAVEVTSEGGDGRTPYVSEHPYVAGSYMSSAITRVFGSAMSGNCASRPELALAAIPLEVTVTPVACRGKTRPEDLFGPLGWHVEAHPVVLDSAFPEWGSVHSRIVLKGTQRLSDALRHLCVLLPALDGNKHYFVSEDEVQKLIRLGDGWLDAHPVKDVIVRRYLGFGHLVRAAKEAMRPQDETDNMPDGLEATTNQRKSGFLQEARISTAIEKLAAAGARKVADMGCGEGDLVAAIAADRRFDGVIGVDPSPIVLERASRRLRLDKMQPTQRARIELIQGAAGYRDTRLSGCDAYALLEVIEHVDAWNLKAIEETVFGSARPRTVVMTTPNREWNATIPALADGKLRHGDHRFEWTRHEFELWAEDVCNRHGYSKAWFPVGTESPEFGPPTQGFVLTRINS